MQSICLVVLFVVVAEVASQQLERPVPELCAKRRSDFQLNGHHYLFSWADRSSNKKYTWFAGRNYCRKQCMDLVSLETLNENEIIKEKVVQGRQRYIWTSGRKCDFPGCEDKSFQPADVNGWFWAGSSQRMPASTDRRNTDWAQKGIFPGVPQPDNRDGDESCLGILSWDVYDDSDRHYRWHDIGCGHKKPIVCEDSDELLGFARSISRGVEIF